MKKSLTCLLLLVFLAGCASGPPKRLAPPQIHLQEMERLGEQWRVQLRVRNQGNFTIGVDSVSLAIAVDGQDAPAAVHRLDLNIPSFSNELFTITWSPSGEQRAAMQRLADAQVHSLDYRLHGQIQLSEPRRSFTFETSAFLSPTPGKPGSFR